MSVSDDDLFNEDPALAPDDNDNDLIKNLRQKARDGARAVKENGTLKTENSELKSEKLLRTAGLDGLKPAQQQAILRHVSGEVTAESLKAAAVELEFIQPDPAQQLNEDAQQQMANAAATGAAGQHKTTDLLTPEEFGKWDMPRRTDFMTRHPDKFDALKRGENVKVA